MPLTSGKMRIYGALVLTLCVVFVSKITLITIAWDGGY
jgi:hypothetical protein